MNSELDRTVLETMVTKRYPMAIFNIVSSSLSDKNENSSKRVTVIIAKVASLQVGLVSLVP